MIKKLCLFTLIILSHRYGCSAEREDKFSNKEKFTVKLALPYKLLHGQIIPTGTVIFIAIDGQEINHIFDKNGKYLGAGGSVAFGVMGVNPNE